MPKRSIRFSDSMEKYILKNAKGETFTEKIKNLVEKGFKRQYQEKYITEQIQINISKIMKDKEDALEKEIYQLRVKNRMIQKILLLMVLKESTPEKIEEGYKKIRDITYKEMKEGNLNLNFLDQFQNIIDKE